MAEREYFPCYHSYFKKCEKLTDQELGRLFRALMMYSSTGERQELAGRESIAFDFIADDIDRADGAYRDKCDKNAENGKMGGRPKKRTVKEKPNGFLESQSKDKGKDKDNTPPPDGGGSIRAREAHAAPVPAGGGQLHPADPNIAAVFSAYAEKVGQASPMTERIRDKLLVFLDGLGPEVCIRAMDEAVEMGKISWRYVERVLESKRVQGVRSIEDWNAAEKKHGTSKPKDQKDFQPTPERIRKNNDWLDEFLKGQEAEGTGAVE